MPDPPTMRTFRPYNLDQNFLLPPDIRDWLPDDHLAHFIADLVPELDLTPIYAAYADQGHPPYEPQLMTALHLYGYAIGVTSSRKIEIATYESVPFRFLAANQHPDYTSISEFRRIHREALEALFPQTVRLCEKAGLVGLDHVSIDGTKVKANASIHKAMSYDRMETKEEELAEKERELRRRVKEHFDEAERVDAEEDRKYGKGKRGNELPEELRFTKSRLAKIREAKKTLEEEARRKVEEEAAKKRAEQEIAEAEAKRLAGEARQAKEEEVREELRVASAAVETEAERAGRAAERLEERLREGVVVDPKAQKNFTDPESRVMKDGATTAFVQGYNCQAAVDAGSQVIVAAEVTQEANDKRQLNPMLDAVKETTGRYPEKTSEDSGYCSEEAILEAGRRGVDLYVATKRWKHGEEPPYPKGRTPAGMTPVEKMQRKVETKAGREEYAKRKETVEPVFGQIRTRGLRQFLLRGVQKVGLEWKLWAATHNILKLWRQSCRVGATG